MKNLVIIILLLILAAVVYYYSKYSFNNQAQAKKTAKPTPAKEQLAAVIDYTDQGFFPQTVTIKKGETVEWLNKSSNKDMWVASNPHPTHTNYPDFDQLRSVSQGGTYSFTFDKVGNWGYHNHLNPSNKATVLVQQ